jgi:heme exporter protein D
MGEFFAMGGYGGYVWPAYIIAAVVMAGLLLASLRALHSRQAELDALEARRRGAGEGSVDEA